MARLSAREIQIMELVCKGHSLKPIAERIGISHHTARSHFDTIRLKLHAHTRASVAAAYMRLRIQGEISDSEVAYAHRDAILEVTKRKGVSDDDG